MMRVAELWRYPVKSLAGERLERAELTVDGIAGDRVVHVRDARGRVITARTQPKLLGLSATLGPDGEPRIGGRPWASGESAAAVHEADRKSTRLNSSHLVISYAVFCLKKKKKRNQYQTARQH